MFLILAGKSAGAKQVLTFLLRRGGKGRRRRRRRREGGEVISGKGRGGSVWFGRGQSTGTKRGGNLRAGRDGVLVAAAWKVET